MKRFFTASSLLLIAACGLFAKGQQDLSEAKGQVEIVVPTGGYYVETLTEYFVPLVKEKMPQVEIKISTEASEGTSGTEAMAARLAAGDIPDLYIGPRGAMAADYARENRLVALDTMVGAKELEAQILPNLIDKSLGSLYYFPYEAITTLMLYNRDLFEEAGLNPDLPPETWSEFIHYAEKISALPDRSWGNAVYGATTWTEALNWGGWYWNMLAPVYANFNDGQHQLFNEYGTDIVFDEPERNLVEFFRYMKALQQNAPDSMGTRIWNREVGMWPQFGVGWIANLKEGRDEPMEIGKDVSVAPIPVLEKGMTHWSMYGGRGIVLFKTNEEQEQLAFEVLKLLYNGDFYLEYCKDLKVLPVVPAVAEDEFFKKDNIRPFIEALQNVVEEESYPAFDEVANIMLANLSKVIITEELTPEEAVQVAAEEARKALLNY
ncbi:MAG: extracellular solute-binding protein [Spirochaetales bacterium]|nr:extracellular solute-binding protein [Spirochaetales bacterium]